MIPCLVGICGHAGSGKSVIANHLSVTYGHRLVKIAGPLKTMLRSIGLTDRELEGDLKEAPCELLCGQTPRHAMQSLGSEWGRGLIHPDLWVRAWERKARALLSEGLRVVVDDVRMANEAAMVRALGGTLLRVTRPGVGPVNGHSSESLLEEVSGVITVVTDGTPEALAQKVDAALEQSSVLRPPSSVLRPL